MSQLICAGCGWRAPDDDPMPFRCGAAAAGDDIDHVLRRTLDLTRVSFPEGPAAGNPFARYRGMLHSYHLARAYGIADDAYVELVTDLEYAVRTVDGAGFTATPLARQARLSDALGFGADGGVWVKDETRNVSGSHKGRHLMGLMLFLLVTERAGLVAPGGARLAIASCGNAALAAAVVAAAARRPLDVFVPTDADPTVIARLVDLGAHLVICPREEGVPGDPTYARLLAAIDQGSVPFTCQGNLNGLAIEGGATMGYEVASDRRELDLDPDRVFIQVGGGALASAWITAADEAFALGVTSTRPQVHTVQTWGAFPLDRAFSRVQERVTGGESRGDAVAFAAHHRSAFMWPWEEAPQSVAGGILDDETYDWLAVVDGMLATGGSTHVVDEPTLVEANELATALTGIDVDPTGSSGLAGVVQARREGSIAPGETVLVLFTGARR